jgi:hypothetical protein
MCAGVVVCARNGAQEIVMSEFAPILAEFMTIEELAEELGRNKRTLDRWDALGIGPPRTRVGRTVLYRRTSVQTWLAAQEHPAGAFERGNPTAAKASRVGNTGRQIRHRRADGG